MEADTQILVVIILSWVENLLKNGQIICTEIWHMLRLLSPEFFFPFYKPGAPLAVD